VIFGAKRGEKSFIPGKSLHFSAKNRSYLENRCSSQPTENVYEKRSSKKATG